MRRNVRPGFQLARRRPLGSQLGFVPNGTKHSAWCEFPTNGDATEPTQRSTLSRGVHPITSRCARANSISRRRRVQQRPSSSTRAAAHEQGARRARCKRALCLCHDTRISTRLCFAPMPCSSRRWDPFHAPGGSMVTSPAAAAVRSSRRVPSPHGWRSGRASFDV